VDAVLGSDDAVLHAFVQFGAAVYGNGRSAGGVDGCDEVNSRMFHHPDSNKDALTGRESPISGLEDESLERSFSKVVQVIAHEQTFQGPMLEFLEKLSLSNGPAIATTVVQLRMR
jgi:hypothetical protein